MYFPDLSPYSYSNVPTGLPGVVNVGWLGSAADFSRGAIDRIPSERLSALAAAPVLRTRGTHTCELCLSAEGNGEVWLGDGAGKVYAAPALICHYVAAHDYLPPAAFLTALAQSACSLSDRECSERIARHLEKLNTSPEPSDILIPYFVTKVYWPRDAFPGLSAFEEFVSRHFPFPFSTIALGDDGYHVFQETGTPEVLLRRAADATPIDSPRPYKCRFRPKYGVNGEQEVELAAVGGELAPSSR